MNTNNIYETTTARMLVQASVIKELAEIRIMLNEM